MKIMFKWFKRADNKMNRILIPKILIEKYGNEFYIEWYDDGTIKLVPYKKGE
jgi:hypothetical protein